MRRIEKARRARPWPRSPKGQVDSLISRPLDAGTFRLEGGVDLSSTCLNCPEQPCIRFDETERPQGTVIEAVCPVEAISFDRSHTELLIAESCFSCGLCVMRCPYDSLALAAGQGQPLLGGHHFKDFETCSAEAFAHAISTWKVLVDLSAKAEIIDQLVANAARTTQSQFYPLVASLLTSLGLPTTLPPGGDTNNRIDGLIYHSTHSVPIEIKSPTETETINIKSVQQAIENKIVIGERHTERYPSNPDATSLSIGYLYPNDRSGVAELIEDAFATYGIRVGLISLRHLYELVWERYAARSELDISKILTLKGQFRQ